MPVNGDGTLRPYTDDEIEGFGFQQRGVRDGSHPEETFSPSGNGCTRKWFCDWASRFDVVKHLAGEVLPWDDGGTPRITRLLPQRHPTFTKWVCTQASVTGFQFTGEYDEGGGRGNRMPIYSRAEIVARYEQVPYQLQLDADVTSEIERFVTEPGYPDTPSEPSAEYLQFPGGILKYVTSDGSPPHGVPIPINVGMPLVGEKIQAIWHRIPQVRFGPGTPLFTRLYGDPLDGDMPWVGSLNSTTLFGRPPLTCLLESAIPSLKSDPTGVGYSWSINFRWIYRPQTHLRLYYFDTKAVPTIPNGYYLFRRNAVYSDPLTWADGDSMHHIRDHADGLFKVD